MKLLHRFCFSFEGIPPFSILGVGCGVTAYGYGDAFEILKRKVFTQSLSAFSVIEDIDVSTLDANTVLPNMGLVTQRGVWFPLGYQ